MVAKSECTGHQDLGKQFNVAEYVVCRAKQYGIFHKIDGIPHDEFEDCCRIDKSARYLLDQDFDDTI